MVLRGPLRGRVGRRRTQLRARAVRATGRPSLAFNFMGWVIKCRHLAASGVLRVAHCQPNGLGAPGQHPWTEADGTSPDAAALGGARRRRAVPGSAGPCRAGPSRARPSRAGLDRGLASVQVGRAAPGTAALGRARHDRARSKPNAVSRVRVVRSSKARAGALLNPAALNPAPLNTAALNPEPLNPEALNPAQADTPGNDLPRRHRRVRDSRRLNRAAQRLIRESATKMRARRNRHGRILRPTGLLIAVVRVRPAMTRDAQAICN